MSKPRLCAGKTKKGGTCNNYAVPNSKFCRFHQSMSGLVVEEIDGKVETFCPFCHAVVEPTLKRCKQCNADLNKTVEVEYYRPVPEVSTTPTPKQKSKPKWKQWWGQNAPKVFSIIYVFITLGLSTAYAVTWHTRCNAVYAVCDPYLHRNPNSISSTFDAINATLSNWNSIRQPPYIQNILMEPDVEDLYNSLHKAYQFITFLYSPNATVEATLFFQQLLTEILDTVDVELHGLQSDIVVSYILLGLIDIIILLFGAAIRESL